MNAEFVVAVASPMPGDQIFLQSNMLLCCLQEEESYKRRQSAAKEVVAGYVPPIYEQILTQ